MRLNGLGRVEMDFRGWSVLEWVSMGLHEI